MMGTSLSRPWKGKNTPDLRSLLQAVILIFLISIPLMASSTEEVVYPVVRSSVVYSREGVCLDLSFDEGAGQFAYDLGGLKFPTENSSAERVQLGSLATRDENDPLWSCNTPQGRCIDLSEGDFALGTCDLGIEDEAFTLQMMFYPRELSGLNALFSFEDSDNEINGLYIDDGNIMTRWGGGENIYSSFRLTTGSWYALGFTYSPPVETVYLNGMIIGTTSWKAHYPKITDYHSFQIGAWLDEDSVKCPFDGMIDELRIERGAVDLGGISGSWNFQEGAIGKDRIVHDRSGNGMDGLCVNIEDRDLSTGPYGNGITFDGKDEYVDCGSSPNYPFDTRSAWTVSLWIRPGPPGDMLSSNGIPDCFLGYTSTNGSDQDVLEIGLDTSYHVRYFLATTEGGNVSELKGTSERPLSTITWTHLDIILGSGDLGYYFSIYENTANEIVREGPFDGIIENPACNLTLGGSTSSHPSFFSGSLDEVQVLNRASIRDVQYDSSRWTFDGDTTDDSKFQTMDLSNSRVTFSGTVSKYSDRSAYFNGNDAYLFQGSPAQLMPDKISIKAWVQPLTVEEGDVVVSMADETGESAYSLTLDMAGHVTFYLRIAEGDSPVQNLKIVSRTVVDLRSWSHITAEFDGKRVSIYIDGCLDNFTESGGATGVVHYGTGNNVFSVGARAGPVPSDFYHGYIDELEVSGSPVGVEGDLDGDGMSLQYEISRSVDSWNFNPNECNARYALLIGNNDNTSDRNVGYASVQDARDMRYYLRSVGYNECDILFLAYEKNVLRSQFPETDYFDMPPTGSGVVEALDILRESSTMSDLVLILYTGHGDQIADSDGDEDYCDFSSSGKNMSKQDEGFALSDGLNGDPDRLLDDDYSKLTLRIKARQMVHLLINCNSGGFFEDIEQGYESVLVKPWTSFMVLTPAHENDVAYVRDRVNSFFGESIINKALRRSDADDWSDRKDFGRVSWDPDVDVTLNNMMFMEQDGSLADNPTKMDTPPHWQRNHYTEDGYQPGMSSGTDGQDFPDFEFDWGKNDQCTRWVSRLDYSPSNGNGIVDLEEAFYFSAHNEYLGEGEINPEADSNQPTDLGDDPLIFDLSADASRRTYL